MCMESTICIVYCWLSLIMCKAVFGLVHDRVNIKWQGVFVEAGFGSWIHGSAQVCRGAHDKTSSIYNCEVTNQKPSSLPSAVSNVSWWGAFAFLSKWSGCFVSSGKPFESFFAQTDGYTLCVSEHCRNKRGKEMLDLVRPLLDITPTISTVCNFFLSS
jgi:hypothetical protein